MAAFNSEQVLSVRHWNDTLFSFATSRSPGLRFENGHFLMIGLPVAGKPLLRAYSIASANHDEHLEFFSIKVQNGPLTSRLQHLQAGDEILVGSKPTGTLVIRDLRPGRHLYLLSTGTGLAPFLSIIRDPETYARFEKIVLVHGARHISEIACGEAAVARLMEDPHLGEYARTQLIHYPTVTRAPFRNQGRVTALLDSGKLCEDVGLPRLDPAIADAATFLHESAHFGRLSLYEQRLTRNLHKNLATLRDLQADRRRHESETQAEEVLLARANDINGLPCEAPATPTPNGFVFSNRA